MNLLPLVLSLKLALRLCGFGQSLDSSNSSNSVNSSCRETRSVVRWAVCMSVFLGGVLLRGRQGLPPCGPCERCPAPGVGVAVEHLGPRSPPQRKHKGDGYSITDTCPEGAEASHRRTCLRMGRVLRTCRSTWRAACASGREGTVQGVPGGNLEAGPWFCAAQAV